MLRFRLLGFDVLIHPLFWLILVVLGAGHQPFSGETVAQLIIFMAVATLSILVHELGHAWIGTRLGGGTCTIVLWAMGGLASYHGTTFDRSSRFWSIFAGPAAGFLLLLLGIAGLCLVTSPAAGLQLTSTFLFGTPPPPSESLGILLEQPRLITLFRDLVWINFWWNLINLAPIPPLDGGQISLLFLRERTGYLISLVFCALLLAWALLTGRLFTLLIIGYLAYQSFIRWRQPRQHPPVSF